jgi:hypothetical protein
VDAKAADVRVEDENLEAEKNRRAADRLDDLFQIKLSGSCFLRGAKSLDYRSERAHHALVAFSYECGENVLADLVSPEMITAVAARMRSAV